MTDSIIRLDPDEDGPAFMLARATAQDARLSWEAWGLLAYLHSLPRDWRISRTDLQKRRKGGRDRMLRMLKELRDLGYVVSVTVRDEAGVIVRHEHLVRMRPRPPLPDTAQPDTANTAHTEVQTVEDRDRESTTPRMPPKGGAETLQPVFAAWKEATSRNGTTVLDGKRIRAIKDRLKEGFTVEQLVAAVAAIPLSDFHNGRDPKTREYGKAQLARLTELTLHLRDAQHVEYLLALVGAPSPNVSEHDPRIGTADDPRYRAEPMSDDELRRLVADYKERNGNG